jgi:excisionase family DNA binding protein
MDNYLTCDEVAAKFKVKKKTIWSWIRTKKLNAIQTGKNYSIRPEDVRAFEEARQTQNQ